MTSWTKLLATEKQQSYFIDTLNYVNQRRAAGVEIFPPQELVFEAFATTPFENLKVVIIGQDPYHGIGQAHGLCFSVMPGIQPPPSLINIFQELASDIADFLIPNHGYLKTWALQGVLLLNTLLTVEQGKAQSHKHLGWERFTDKVIEQINIHASNIVFLLWGFHAQQKKIMIDQQKHLVLTAAHPSPMSANNGFFGCRHFSKTNHYLKQQGQQTINWQI